MSAAQDAVKLGARTTFAVLWPYLRERFTEQLKSIWFIIAYLAFFQIVVLQLPLMYGAMITVGIVTVAAGLMFFMEGLRLGLMPLGENIGTVLPRKAKLPVILLFALLIGIGATFAEPAISVLRAAGSGVDPERAPLLFSLLNDFAGQLVAAVGVGVGIAVVLGVMRFFYGWSLKVLVIPAVLVLSALTIWTYSNPVLSPIIGLAWDSGAVTTGPVTVPLVLALGIGVCRIVGKGDSGAAGFGIVTLASLFPILAVLLLGNAHYFLGDYYGGENYQATATEAAPKVATDSRKHLPVHQGFTEPELEHYKRTNELPEDTEVRYTGGQLRLVDGQIVHEGARITLVKKASGIMPESDSEWDPKQETASTLKDSVLAALQAVLPLCLFLLLTLRLLREKLADPSLISIGISFAILGMALFGLGITIGLTPLGEQLGSNVPAAFAEITPWGMLGLYGPLHGDGGKLLAILFGFFLGYGATLAEPALNALGDTVQKVTVGAFKKSLLMQSVALGVGLGIGAGVFKIAFNVPLVYMLLPPYALLCLLTWLSSEDFVNFGWDSAGVTTGPITVPLVLAMGLGIGANVPGATDGFGILALASVGPILTVLTVGMVVARTSDDNATDEPTPEATS